jgi:hypothetical protein
MTPTMAALGPVVGGLLVAIDGRLALGEEASATSNNTTPTRRQQ